MNDREYLRTCVDDIISALKVKDLPMRVDIGKDQIFPLVALERAEMIKAKLFPEGKGKL